MTTNFYHEWISDLSNEDVLHLVNELWGENEFTNFNVAYLKKCFKVSKRVYDYYVAYVLMGD
tara:strand:- start:32 stop:217 length:186 start_codon:yes stop_codon:yes gene_type:complete